MRKLLLIFLIAGFTLLGCLSKGKGKKWLKVEPAKKFQKLEFKKIFEINRMYCKLCLPTAEGVLCLQSLDPHNKKFRLSLYDFSAKLIKQRDFLTGQGPNELMAAAFFCAWVTPDMKLE